MKKLRVLLVDDEIMIREGFKRLFDWEAHDCQIVGEAADGMEALAKIDSLDPDIAIMDINIPIMNGLKVIQLARIKHPDTAFVIVSGYDDFSYCREALRLQITDYILKPVNYEEFGTCIDNLKIALFRRQSSKTEDLQEERTITGLTRYMQEHLAEEISLSVLAEEFHLNGRAFLNDPDVFFLRDHNLTFTWEQKLLLAKINNLFGRVLFVSDDAGEYSEAELEVLKETFRESDAKILDVKCVGARADGNYEIKFIENGEEKLLYFNLFTGASNILEVR